MSLRGMRGYQARQGIFVSLTDVEKLIANVRHPRLSADSQRKQLDLLGQLNELHRAALAANGVSELYAEAVARLLAQAGNAATEVTAVGAHGQTVRHRPLAFDGTGYTLQLLNAGRHPFLQSSQTLPSLAKLAQYGLLPEAEATHLSEVRHRREGGQRGGCGSHGVTVATSCDAYRLRSWTCVHS